MKVYVLLHNYHYEGSELVDVYRDKDAADKAAATFNAYGYRGEDQTVSECELIED